MSTITVAEAAKRLDVSKQYVHKMIDAGRIPATVERITARGKTYAIDPVQLALFASKRSRPSGHATISQAADVLGRDQSNVRRWIAAGHLPTITHNGRMLIPESALREFNPPRRGRPTKEKA